ncbi:MAG: sugar nucleotide-binding protein [Oligoflexia bacterium]|nr:sugar nucleotide-binding protein [Oligoflexia bacterium]
MSNIKKTVLIFGISSFVGSNLAEFLKKDYRVFGTYYKSEIHIPDILTIPCDILNREVIQSILYAIKPDIVIYAIGLSKFGLAADVDKDLNALNTLGVFNVANYSERYKSKLCYISSSYIFPGIDKVFNENDTPDPCTEYGKTKSSAEFFIQKSCLNYIIFRSSSLYGRSFNPKRMNNFELLESKLIKGISVICDGNVYLGHLDVMYLALIIKMSIENDVTNRLFQIGSTDVASFYDFARKYARIAKLNENLITKGKWQFPEVKKEVNDEEVGYKRFFKLSIDNLESCFSVKMPTIEESIEFTYCRFGGRLGEGKKSKNAGTLLKYI